MTRKKTPKPLFSVKHDFVDSLDAFISAAVLLHQTVKTALDLGAVSGKVAENVRSRLDAFERSMLTGSVNDGE